MHQLNALTAYKIGELSLIRSSSAFRRIYSNFDSEKKQWNEKDAFQRISRGNVIYA
ncbi:hypothetical protein IPdc08_00764 [archaeon]|nr:hypothetical protein IPdc08_00764 [archaeon]